MPVSPRLAADVLAEISLHLVEPLLMATISSVQLGGFGNGSFGGPPDYGGSAGYVLAVSSTVGAYPGAQAIVGWQLDQAEIGTVIAVDPAAETITIASLQNQHQPGEQVFAPTFPTQAPSDPLWTQTEALEYLARAQNEFLVRCSVLLERFPDQIVALGQQFQTTPATAIELERVAVQSGSVDTPLATIGREGGVVTATVAAAYPGQFTPGLALWVDGVMDASFNSASTETADLALLVDGTAGATLTWLQPGLPDVAVAALGGTVSLLLWPRLYETTQSQVANRDPQWFYNQPSSVPTDWYEDRTGNYQWGVAPIPRSSYLVELLASVRGPETLGLLDALAVPPIMCYIVKYAAMASFLSKDGDARSPSYAAYCRQRFEMGVVTVQRYLSGMVDSPVGGI